MFSDFQVLARVWTHPKAVILSQTNKQELKITNESDSEGSLNDFIVDSDDGVMCLDDSGDEKDLGEASLSQDYIVLYSITY